MSRTVSPEWYRRASWPALQLLAKRRHAELLAAVAEHYATYLGSGDSARLLFDCGIELSAKSEAATRYVPTNIERPAYSAGAALRHEDAQRIAVQKRLDAAWLASTVPTSDTKRRANQRRRRELKAAS